MESLALLIFICLATFVFTIIFSVSLVFSYVRSRDSSAFLSGVSIAAIGITLFCVLLIPVDIYSVSSGLDDRGLHSDYSQFHNTTQAIKALYYTFYALFLLFAFIVLPFAYFYYEEEGENRSTSARAFSAAKWTIGFVLFFVVLLVCGIIVRRGKTSDSDDSHNPDWKDKLIGNFSAGDAVLGFAIGCLSCVGLIAYVLYASYGLAKFPLKLMASASYAQHDTETNTNSVNRNNYNALGGGTDDIEASTRSSGSRSITKLSSTELDLQLKRNRENIEYLEQQHDSANISTWPLSDQKQITELRKEQRKLQAVLQGRLNRGEEKSNNNSSGSRSGGRKWNCWPKNCSARCWNCLAPFRIVIAIPLLLLSLLIVVSQTITVVDKFKHSDCGASCGYALSDPQILNPIDEALKKLSSHFPLDWIFFSGLVIYIYLCCVSGMISMGVRILIWKLYNIKKRRTEPHALMMAAWLLMFIALVLNMQATTLSPKYTTFGNQFYISHHTVVEGNHTRIETVKEACTIENSQSFNNSDAEATCSMTQVGTFINSVSVEMPFFAVILFYSNLLFLVLFVVFLIHGVFRTKEEWGNDRYNTLEDQLNEDSD